MPAEFREKVEGAPPSSPSPAPPSRARAVRWAVGGGNTNEERGKGGGEGQVASFSTPRCVRAQGEASRSHEWRQKLVRLVAGSAREKDRPANSSADGGRSQLESRETADPADAKGSEAGVPPLSARARAPARVFAAEGAALKRSFIPRNGLPASRDPAHLFSAMLCVVPSWSWIELLNRVPSDAESENTSYTAENTFDVTLSGFTP